MSQQINLFNPVFMNQRKYFSAVAMLQGLVLVIAGSGLFYAYAVYHVKSLSSQFDEISKHYADEQARLSRYQAEFSPEESHLKLEGELKSAETKLAAQNKIIETLKSGAIGNSKGYSEYMRAFAQQAVNGLWLTGFDIVGDASEMSISGKVMSPDLLPTYVLKLSREPVMRGKSFASLQMQRGGGDRYVEFALHSSEAGRAEAEGGAGKK